MSGLGIFLLIFLFLSEVNTVIDNWAIIAGNWADGEVKMFPYNSVGEYSDKSIVLQNVAIDPRKIIGSDHPRYYGTSWRDFLLTGKRVSDNILRYEENPNYYGDVCQQKSHYGHWSLAQIGEEYYICEGNHRSLIAKFLAHEKALKLQIIPKIIRIDA